ncbi:MAG: glutamyl-tRNA(Gln) amidotransferase, C subunit [uncultured bacterium]|nr:MAG: glutamyl-tRNA(Gln) amidotransferase, C subunit [uncultured bacterium]
MKKTTLSAAQVKHIAKLANLPLTEEEIRLFQKQLSHVLDYFKLLQELDTEKVSPTSQVTGLGNVFRSDETRPSLPVESALKNTKKTHNQFFKVASVWEK